MIGTSAYYGQLIGNPILGSINALLFSKKLGIDIWNWNQMPSTKSIAINRILVETDAPPWPPMLGQNIVFMGQNNEFMGQMDWDTYISLNAYGIANLIAGITELIPNKFETIRKVTNMITGGALISSGVAMGINNNFTNDYSIPTIIAGASEIEHFCTRIIYMHDGNIIEKRTVNDVVKEYGSVYDYTFQQFQKYKKPTIAAEKEALAKKKGQQDPNKIVNATKAHPAKQIPLLKLMLKYYIKGFFVPFFLVIYPILILGIQGESIRHTGLMSQVRFLLLNKWLLE